MCGRYSIVHDLLGIQTFFGVSVIDGLPANTQISRYNIAPTQNNWVVFQDERDENRHLAQMRWGLIPSWAKADDVPAIGNRMVNARSESALEKPSFKRAALARRCLVPVTAFYEWKTTSIGKKKVKVPQKIESTDEPLLAIAGIFETWKSKTSQDSWTTYALLTRDADSFMSQIHDRMPVFVPRELWGEWLDRENQDPLRVGKLLNGLSQGTTPHLKSLAVSTDLNSPRNEGAQLWAPFSGGERESSGDPQGSLF